MIPIIFCLLFLDDAFLSTSEMLPIRSISKSFRVITFKRSFEALLSTYRLFHITKDSHICNIFKTCNVVYTFHPSIQEAEASILLIFEVSFVYKVGSQTAMATLRNPVCGGRGLLKITVSQLPDEPSLCHSCLTECHQTWEKKKCSSASCRTFWESSHSCCETPIRKHTVKPQH